MRQPMTGFNNTQKMLYYCNNPEIMEQARKTRLAEFQRRAGIEPAPEDPAYREIPKTRSPFRQ